MPKGYYDNCMMYQGYYGNGYHGYPQYGTTPAEQGQLQDHYRQQCLMQGASPGLQIQQGQSLEYAQQGYGASPCMGPGTPPMGHTQMGSNPANPQMMGQKPQEIYPWMRESRHNAKQRTQPAQPQSQGKNNYTVFQSMCAINFNFGN
jgi:hypothetical protein